MDKLYPGVPFVSLVFPVAPLAACDRFQAINELDPHDVLRHFVAELPLNPQAKRRAVPDGERLTIEIICKDGLGMIRIFEIDALIVIISHVIRIGGMKDHITGLREGTDFFEKGMQRNSLPLADG